LVTLVYTFGKKRNELPVATDSRVGGLTKEGGKVFKYGTK